MELQQYDKKENIGIYLTLSYNVWKCSITVLTSVYQGFYFLASSDFLASFSHPAPLIYQFINFLSYIQGIQLLQELAFSFVSTQTLVFYQN